MNPLVSQHEVLDYISFEDCSISCYDLSGVLLVFQGEISEPYEYHPGYAQHITNLYDHSVYEPYIFINEPRPYRDNRPEFSHLEIADVWWRHFVPYEEQLAAVGYCKVRVNVLWPAPDAFPYKINLKDANILLDVAFRAAHEPNLAPEHFLYPKKKEELKKYAINGRSWYRADHGSISVDRFYSFYTALTNDHMLSVHLHPQGHWQPGTEPPQEDLEKVFVSFWDFMDRLRIIDDKSQQNRAPGIELKGAMLERHLWEQEQNNKRKEDEALNSESSWGW